MLARSLENVDLSVITSSSYFILYLVLVDSEAETKGQLQREIYTLIGNGHDQLKIEIARALCLLYIIRPTIADSSRFLLLLTIFLLFRLVFIPWREQNIYVLQLQILHDSFLFLSIFLLFHIGIHCMERTKYVLQLKILHDFLIFLSIFLLFHIVFISWRSM